MMGLALSMASTRLCPAFSYSSVGHETATSPAGGRPYENSYFTKVRDDLAFATAATALENLIVRDITSYWTYATKMPYTSHLLPQLRNN